MNNETDEKSCHALKKLLSGCVEDGLKEIIINCSKEVALIVLNCITPGSGTIVKTIFTIICKALS